MKKLILALLLSPISVNASETRNLNMQCTSAIGETFTIEIFQDDKCRIERKFQDKIEVVTNVSLCVAPNEVHSDFSFWYINPQEARAYYLGSLEQQGQGFYGVLAYSTQSIPSSLASLECFIK